MERAWEASFEPFRVKAAEPLPVTTRAERERALREAGGDLSLVPADKVLIDLSPDALSEASVPPRGAGAESFDVAARELTGMRHVLPAHSGRAAERILFKAARSAGRTVLSNALGETARANAEAAGAKAIDLPTLETLDLSFDAPFKGDVDLHALEARIRERGADGVALIVLTVSSGRFGGQPASMANLRAAQEIARAHRIPLLLDASRFAENAWLIKSREHGYGRRTPAEIAQEMLRCADGCWIDGRAAASAPGALIALRDGALAEACRAEAALGDGAPAASGLEALAHGLADALDEGALAHRAFALARLAGGLRAAGAPVVEPAGGRAVLLDAARLVARAAPADRPARLLARELYLSAGVRGGETVAPEGLLELAVPRRTYTLSQLDFVLEAVLDVAARADELAPARTAGAAA
jgi:tryptophanase